VVDGEMHRVFNCGIGMVAVVARESVQQALQVLHDAGEPAMVIGSIKPRSEGEAPTVVV
ncbi:MAG: phosphoribosylformylglycinamidine cyclo-ligase, partial [Candidatus Accumulibacter sp.]|nr:phosphoribosylformylglycinamidine cyclo-ligase [Accumulibacter sp.]